MPASALPAPPFKLAQRALLLALRPIERLLRPRYFGFQHVPRGRACMFVGNHQLLALDTLFLISELWRRDVWVRPLADDFLFALPPLSGLLHSLGLVQTSQAAAGELLAAGQSVLVYPGGAREAAKSNGLMLELDWWDRLGFARLALQHRTPVVTVAATGIDDRVHLVLSGANYLASPLSQVIDGLRLRHDMLPPLVLPRGVPRPAFKFGQPIEIDHFFGHDEQAAERRLRAEVAEQLRRDIRWLRDRV